LPTSILKKRQSKVGAAAVRIIGRTNREGGRLHKLGRWMRLQCIRMVRDNSTPARTGLGLALGAFIGIFPSFLLGTPIAFYVAGRFGWNRAAAVAGTFLTNPVTAPVFYTLSAWLGQSILGTSADTARVHGLIDHLRHFGLAFLLGNTLIAATVAAVTGMGIFLVLKRHGRAGLRRMFLRSRSAQGEAPRAAL
jgi:uncharacterized protein (DUF2062 family)